MRSSPMTPASSTALTRRHIGSRRYCSATLSVLPLRCCASMIRLQPRIVSANGFSQKRCRPRSRASQATAWCEPESVVMSTPCRSGNASTIVSIRSKTRGRLPSSSSAKPARCSALSRRRSQAATSSTLHTSVWYSSLRPRRWRPPIPPQPTMAIGILSIWLLSLALIERRLGICSDAGWCSDPVYQRMVEWAKVGAIRLATGRTRKETRRPRRRICCEVSHCCPTGAMHHPRGMGDNTFSAHRHEWWFTRRRTARHVIKVNRPGEQAPVVSLPYTSTTAAVTALTNISARCTSRYSLVPSGTRTPEGMPPWDATEK